MLGVNSNTCKRICIHIEHIFVLRSQVTCTTFFSASHFNFRVSGSNNPLIVLQQFHLAQLPSHFPERWIQYSPVLSGNACIPKIIVSISESFESKFSTSSLINFFPASVSCLLLSMSGTHIGHACWYTLV